MASDPGRRRVAVTGLGMITPVGLDVESSWDALLSGVSGAGAITHFDSEGYATRIACEIDDFDLGAHISRKEARRYDRFLQLAVVAGDEAMRSAGLGRSSLPAAPTASGALIGSGVGGIATLEANCSILARRGPSRVSPFFIPMFIPDIAAGVLSIRYGLKGPNYATVSACASGTHAIGQAARHISHGDAELMLAGGAEAAVTPITIAGFAAMRAMSRRNDDPKGASRPFDAGRDGFVIGEGAGILVLEEMDRARARGAEILAELAGYGATGDAYHFTAPPPDGEGAQEAMRAALADAGVSADQLDYVNAHGTSTPANDSAETKAIKAVLGERAYGVVVGSTKSMTGHLLGAAGAIEAVMCVMACRSGRIPPTINFSEPDAECDLDYAHGGAVERTVEAALNNSFGFGGHNACLVTRRYED